MRIGGRGEGWLGLILACLVLLGMGCSWKGRRGLDGVGPVSSMVVSMRSEVLVFPPMSSLPYPHPSWEPEAQRKPRGPVLRLDAEGESGVIVSKEFVSRWLPTDETGTMRRAMHLPVAAKGPPLPMMNRMRRNMPAIRKVFMSYALPPELAFLPMIESRFESWAVSPAGAAGLWQLMPEVARRFGLRVSDGEDERFDVHRATEAAAAYLVELHRLFRDWPLALAAYNCGEGAMARALERTGAGTLSELTAVCRENRDFRGLLPGETLDFVPRFVGALHVMSGVEGFEELMRSKASGGREGVPNESFPDVAQVGPHHDGEAMRRGGAILECELR